MNATEGHKNNLKTLFMKYLKFAPEFDNYCEALGKLKGFLESGLVKWTEYEDQYQDALDWLAQTEPTVQNFNRLQNTLMEKRDILEQFQSHLQAIFDWQKDLDRLNM